MRLVSGRLLILAVVCLLATVVYGCQEGELIKVEENCDEYDECIDGTLVRKRCKLGEYFDGKKCDNFLNVKCNKKPCTEGVIYQRGTCGIDYDICQDGKLHRELCPAMYRFNGKSCVPMEICQDATKNNILIDQLVKHVSEANKCTEGDKVLQDKFSYLECINGIFIMKLCKPGFAFNEFTKSCEETVNINLLKNDFCPQADRRPLPDCSKYQVCEKGQYVEKQCPDKMLFDKNYLMCRFQWEATCFDGSCKDGTLLPDLNDCSYYYTCDKGKKVRQKCSLFHSFDPVAQQCTWTKHCERNPCTGDWTHVSQDCTEYTTCKNGYKIKYSCPIFTKYVDGECRYSGNCIQPDALVKKAKCVNGETSRVFGRCTEYWKCVRNEWKLMKCPKDTNFQEDACEQKPCPLIPVLNHCSKFMRPEDENTYECQFGYLFDGIERQCVYTAAARCAEGECVDGDKINHPTDCSKYKVCKDGTWETESCSVFFPHFDITLKQCRYWHYTCAYDPADCVTGNLRPNPTDCKAYESCESYTWRANRCWFWQHFDSRINSCATFSYKCAEIPKQIKTKLHQPKQLKQHNGVVQKQIFANKCTEGEKKPVAETCRWYTECVNGQELPKKCSPCQNYNAEENKCDWVWKKPCKSDVTDPPYVTPSAPSTTSTIIISTPTPAPIKPECDKENDKRGVKNDCHRYQVCKGGKWIDEKCSVWGKFDIITKECFYFQTWKAKCEQ